MRINCRNKFARQPCSRQVHIEAILCLPWPVFSFIKHVSYQLLQGNPRAAQSRGFRIGGGKPKRAICSLCNTAFRMVCVSKFAEQQSSRQVIASILVLIVQLYLRHGCDVLTGRVERRGHPLRDPTGRRSRCFCLVSMVIPRKLTRWLPTLATFTSIYSWLIRPTRS